MPCDSVSVAVVQLSEQGAWLLTQLRERPELKDAIMLAIATELRQLLPDDERWNVMARDYAPIITLYAQRWDDEADVSFANTKPTYQYSRGQTPVAFMDRIKDSVGGAINAVALQLIAELTKADMAASGFEILEDTIRDDGARVIDWEYAVTA